MRIDTLWKRLYKAADIVLAIRPWLFLDDSQLLALKTPDMAEPVYVNVLGFNKMTYGIVFYPGSEGLNDYQMVRSSDELNITEYIMFQQKCFVMYLGNKTDIPQDQMKYFRKYSGMDVNGDFLPYFLRMHGGYYPWTPNKKDAEVLLGYMEMLCECWPSFDGRKDWGLDCGNTVCRMTPGEDGWKCEYIEAPFSGYYAEVPVIRQESIRLAGQSGRIDTDYEADIFYTHTYVQDKNYDYPLNVPIILVCDCETGIALGMNMVTPEDEAMMVFQQVVLDTIAQIGIPGTLYVRSVLFRDGLSQIARELGFRIEVSEDMEVLDELEEQLDMFTSILPDKIPL